MFFKFFLFSFSLTLSLLLRTFKIFSNLDPIFALFLLNRNFDKKYLIIGILSNFLIFDYISNQIGIWTFFSPVCYIFLLLFCDNLIFYNKSLTCNLRYTIFFTVIFDLVTASTGPIFFGQLWFEMLIGQIPFTMMHLISNITAYLVFCFVRTKIYFNERIQWN